ncbi:unnamed protein product, partial [Prorocentrum cordatum]
SRRPPPGRAEPGALCRSAAIRVLRTSGPPEPCSPSAAPPPSRAARSSTRSPAPRPCGRWGTTSPLTPGGPTLLAHGPRVGKVAWKGRGQNCQLRARRGRRQSRGGCAGAHGAGLGQPEADRDNNVDRTPTWARDQVGFGSLSLPMVTKRTGYKRGRPPRPSSEEGMAEEGEEEGGRRRGRH